MKSGRAAAVVVILSLAACGSEHGRAPEKASLGGEVVARVGSTSISSDAVARVARARGIGAREAASLLVDDAVAAEAARARGLDKSPAVQWATTSALARRVAERLRDESRAKGAPTDEEVEEMTAARWRELDLPEQAHVVHAVVIRPKPPSPEANARAQAMATALQKKLAAASTEDFEQVAKAFPLEGFELRVERLPAFIADGRASEGPSTHFDASFAAAAFALKQSGDTSPVVETPFGWHVIRLLERLAPKQPSLEERRAQLTQDIYDARARKAREAILGARRASTLVQITEGAEQLMSEATAAARHD